MPSRTCATLTWQVSEVKNATQINKKRIVDWSTKNSFSGSSRSDGLLHQRSIAGIEANRAINRTLTNVWRRHFSTRYNGCPRNSTIRASFAGVSCHQVLLPQANVEKSAWILVCPGKGEAVSYLVAGLGCVIVHV